MSTFYEKTSEFINKIREFENKKDFDGSINIVDQALSYIEGFMSQEKEPMMQLYYSNYYGIWRLKKQIIEINKKIEPTNNETDARMNNLESRIKRLEEQFEKIRNWQDKHDGT